MPESIDKLQPDRDLQIFFFRPSAIAAISKASPTGFTISGTWRQQFDWCVIEWNRNNVYEHPAFRSLPDGDLSGLVLAYEETRENCIPIESDLFPTVNWPTLRIWTRDDFTLETLPEDQDHFHEIPLYTPERATPIGGSFVSATAEFTLSGSITAGDHIGLGCLNEGWDYLVSGSDDLTTAVENLAAIINTNSLLLAAERTGTSTLKVTYRGVDVSVPSSEWKTGANGNRVGAYVYVEGAETEAWSSPFATLSGGQSPTKWRITIDFSSLAQAIDVTKIRKMRWTYAADLQPGDYTRSEFQVEISNWTVTGTGRQYQVAGPQSVRIEDGDKSLVYSPDETAWPIELGNYSGGTIRHTAQEDASVTALYIAQGEHTLFLGTRYLGLIDIFGADIEIQIDSGTPRMVRLWIGGEDQLIRLPLGDLAAGPHQVTVKHASPDPSYRFYFDFFEICYPSVDLPVFPSDEKVTAATDWDTDHSISIAPERTAWFVHSLGYHGRANHYVGALWFYELFRPGQVYSSGTFTFVGTPPFSSYTYINIGGTVLTHQNLIGDTAATVAKAFELIVNQGSTAVWASAAGNVLTIYSRQMGVGGDSITLAATPDSGTWRVETSDTTLAGGADGDWRTDLTALPRINRAARDWSKAYFEALDGYGLAVTAAFSTELQHGDPSGAAGIAQRYPDNTPVLVNTPAVQTNFSPTSLAYWQQVHLDMAQIMVDAGVEPYLQFGEVQWWYFGKDGVGMTFYDDYTKTAFEAAYGRPMHVFLDHTDDPSPYTEESAFLPEVIGNFTQAAAAFVSASVPDCKFEVLYPLDVNDFALTRVINYAPQWTPANLHALKTESFGFTFGRHLDNAARTVHFGATKGFANNQRAFLVGVGDSFSSWQKEVEMAKAENLESIVLWALDQYCLIGYPTPLGGGLRRASEQGV